jgi:acyl-coenzyme A thioesterase PaaI-like protein
LFHRPVAVGEAVIEVRIIKLGQKLATVEGRLFNADNKLAATLLHTIQPSDMPDGKRPSV